MSRRKKGTRTTGPLNPGMTVSAALAGILRASFDDLARWETQARSWDDVEGVHQVRVNCRRMRAALWSFRSAVPKAVSLPWSDELGWLAGQLGAARDLDVFITEGLASARDQLPLPGLDNLTTLAEHRRAAAYDVVRATLDSDRYDRFKRDFPAWFMARGWEQADLADKQRNKLGTDIDTYARKLLYRLDTRVLETGASLDKSNTEQMHQLRIECKKLRYAAEFFAPIIPGLDALIRQLKQLQDVLGTLNDDAVMCHLLAELLAGQADADTIGCACAMVAWRTRQGDALLANFDERWQRFVHERPEKKRRRGRVSTGWW